VAEPLKAEQKLRAPDQIVPDDLDPIMAGKINTFVRDCKAGVTGLERMWYTCLAFLAGLHYVSWNYTRNALEPNLKVPAWRIRLVVNYALMMVQKVMSKLIRNRPIPEVHPATTEIEDSEIASIASKLLLHHWEKQRMDERLQDYIVWATTCSISYLFPYWDGKLGKDIWFEVDEEDNVLSVSEKSPDELREGARIIKDKVGDVATDIVSPFELLYERGIRDFKELDRCVRRKPRTLSYIRERWPKVGWDVKPEPVGVNMLFERVQTDLVPTLPITPGVRAEPMRKEFATVYEYWELPSRRNPKGWLIHMAGDIILDKGPFPHWYDSLPFIPWVYFRAPWRIQGMSLVEHLIPVQKEYNRARSQNVENRNMMGRPKILEPKGAGLPRTAITSEPGERVRYNPIGNLKPEFWTPPPLPNYEAELTRMIREMQDLASMHEVSHGSIPPGVRSGRAIGWLVEQDETMFGPIIGRLNKSVEEWGRVVLRMMYHNYTERRTVSIAGEGSKPEILSFHGKQFDPTKFDVKIKAGTGMPQSKLAKQDYIKELAKEGFFGDFADPKVRRKVLEWMEFGGVDRMFEETMIDEQRARLENKEMMDGATPMPDEYEAHEEHIYYHDLFRKSDEFRRVSDSIKEIFSTHVEVHRQYLAPPPQAQGAAPGRGAAPGMSPEQAQQAMQTSTNPDEVFQALASQQGGSATPVAPVVGGI